MKLLTIFRQILNRFVRESSPAVISGERPLKGFISSVMQDKFDWAREETIKTLNEKPYVTLWAFEHTPGSSEQVDKGNLRHVRDSDFFIWLVTSEITTPVSNEIREAIASNRRIWVVLIEKQDKWSLETRQLIKEVSLRSKWIDPTKLGGLRKALQMTWEDEVIRTMRGIPGMGRMAHLETVANDSRARCIARWIAAGVPRNEAIQMVDDVNVGQPPTDVIPSLKRPFIILTSEFGSGKSLVAERLLQQAVLDAASSVTGAIPVYLQAQDISGRLNDHVQQISSGIGNPYIQGAFIIIDGADEAGVGTALRIINEARALVESWPNTRIFMTSRPLPVVEEAEEVSHLPLLSEKNAYALIRLVAGENVTAAMEHQWPKAIKDAIRRPLFAILVGGFIRGRHMEIPRSTGELLATLVERSLITSGLQSQNAHPVLCKLAVALIERGGGLIPLREIGDPAVVEQLIVSGLLVSQNGAIGFPLPILTQWFAAQALEKGVLNVEEICTSTKRLDMWRYPLIISVGLFDHNKVTAILGPISRCDPGLASEIVDEGLARWGLANDVLPPPPLEAARRIFDTMHAWVDGIGRIAELIAPICQDGKLMPIGAKSSGPMLLTGWYNGVEDRPPIGELPPNIHIFSSNFEWISLRSARPGRQPAWAWRWTRDDLASSLYQLLDQRRLRTGVKPFLREEFWYSALAVLRAGSLNHEPLDLQKLKNKLPSYPRNGILIINGFMCDLSHMWLAIKQYEAIGENIIKAPYPGPDRDYSRGSWTWSAYSDNQLLRRTQAVYEAALEIYTGLVNEWFDALAKRLLYAVTLPAVLEGYLYPPKGQQYADGPVIFWRFRTLPRGIKTSVNIQLSSTRFGFADFDSVAEYAQLRSLRPEAAEWISYTLHESVLYIFHKFPARELAYSWLSEDLERIHWLDRSISRHY